ncbi:MAG: MoaD/ThiS family protein [Candidatus Bathyarchaeota archaeon]|nr:MAG: MoaD/ThiS family protein [Candidatus Bathyarchaeota archaeon]
MKIKLTAIGRFQRYFPTRTSELDFPGTTLAELLAWVREQYGLDVRAHRNIRITHNSIMVKDFSVLLNDGDRIGFIPVVAGG